MDRRIVSDGGVCREPEELIFGKCVMRWTMTSFTYHSDRRSNSCF